MKDVIVKKNGEPYANEAVARQQMSAMGYTSMTHEPVREAWGWGIAPIKAEQEGFITLQPGDYVSTEGMTEEKYHAVAKAFMAAGCKGGPQPFEHVSQGVVTGWSNVFNRLGFSANPNCDSFTRHLAIDQVLSATNAKPQQEAAHMTVINTLHEARRQRDEAAEELQIAEAALADALDAVRAELGDGFTLEESSRVTGGGSGSELRDLPPEEWREGDLVECTCDREEWVDEAGIRVGDIVTVAESVRMDEPVLGLSIEESNYCLERGAFRFHSRPTR